MVGIFWLCDGRLIVDASPVTMAERYGDCLTHSRNHLDHWNDLQRRREVPADTEYEEHPRGRVIRDASQRFVILADRCILRKKSVVDKIIRTMRLPAESTDTGEDPHYRCYRCLYPQIEEDWL